MNKLLDRSTSAGPVLQNDLKLLEIIAQYTSVSQRELAVHSGLSLGMVNLVLKRLATTGYIQVLNLERRKMRYFLTPQGIAAKSKRAYDYLIRTIRIYATYRQEIRKIIQKQLTEGHSKFVIHGEGDIVDLVRLALDEMNSPVTYRVCATPDNPNIQSDEVPLICHWADKSPLDGISVLEAIINPTIDKSVKGDLHA